MQFFFAATRIAVKALGRNPLRTFLTMLGVIIGVAAVIAMVALGNGARGSVERTLRSAGTSIVQVSAGNYIRGGESMNIASGLGAATTLSHEDAQAIRAIAGAEHVVTGVRTRTWTVASPEARLFSPVAGTEPALAIVHGWTFMHGDSFTAEDVRAAARVAVIGRAASAKLFGEGADPVGRDVQILDTRFTIVGLFRAVDRDQEEALFVPVTTLQALTRRDHLQTITIGVTEAGIASKVAAEVTQLLRQRHAGARAAASAVRAPVGPAPALGPADDFVVRTLAAQQMTKGLYTEVAAFALANMPKLDSATMEEMSGTLNRAGTTMTALLASIAGIALLVGGIGIMTIMLVSVTERTREIGLRLAVGARRREVLLQFLVEAMVLSLAGGTVGVLVGVLAARGLTAVFEWPTAVSAQAIALAFGVAALVGVVFGFYPARQASRLDPMDALRQE